MRYVGSGAQRPRLDSSLIHRRQPDEQRALEHKLDLLGLGLVVLSAAWVAIFAGGGHGRPGPVLWLLAGLVVAFKAGQILSVRPGLVPRLVAVGVAGAFAFTWPGVLSAGGAPTGYANTNATLAALGVIAALSAARHATVGTDRHGWLLLAGGLFVCTLLTESVAGVLSLMAALGLLLLAAATRWPPFALVGGLVALSILLGITGLVACGEDVLGSSDDLRSELWEAAVDLVQEEPVLGIGPGMFAERNPVSDDADLRWVHHEYLQVAAELGVVGFSLVFSLMGWLAVRLAVACGDHRSGHLLVLGIAPFTLAFHATVDHVAHPAVALIVASALAGSATALRLEANQPHAAPSGYGCPSPAEARSAPEPHARSSDRREDAGCSSGTISREGNASHGCMPGRRAPPD